MLGVISATKPQKKFQFIRLVKRAEMIPRGFAPYRYDVVTDAVFCAPFPVNIIFGLIQAILNGLRWWWREVCRDPKDAYEQGVKAGMAKRKKAYQTRVDELLENNTKWLNRARKAEEEVKQLHSMVDNMAKYIPGGGFIEIKDIDCDQKSHHRGSGDHTGIPGVRLSDLPTIWADDTRDQPMTAAEREKVNSWYKEQKFSDNETKKKDDHGQ